jgi:hypothetical protein
MTSKCSNILRVGSEVDSSPQKQHKQQNKEVSEDKEQSVRLNSVKELV